MKTSFNNLRKVLYLFFFLFFLFVFRLNFSYDYNLDIYTTMRFVAIISLVTLFYQLIVIYFFERKISFYLLFLMLSFLFSFGQCYTKLFFPLIVNENFISVGNGFFSSKEIYDSSFIVLFFSLFMSIGYIFFKAKVNINNNKYNENYMENKCLKLTGWILLSISIVPIFVMKIRDIQIINESGYIDTLANPEGIYKFFSLLEGFFPSAIIILLLADRKRTFLVLSILGVYLLLELVGGSRISVFRFAIILFLMWLAKNKLTPLKVVILLLVGFIGMGVLSNVSSMRLDGSLSISQLFNFADAFSVNEDNLLYKTLYEMGNTQVINIIVFTRCPDIIGYCYGSSIWKALSSAIPNFGFWDIHPAMINTDYTFSIFFTDRCGLGSSIYAELFWNFGFLFGLLFSTLIGVLLCYLSNSLDRQYAQNNNIKVFLFLRLMYFIIFLVRTDITMFGRDFIYYTISPIVLCYLIKSIKKGRYY